MKCSYHVGVEMVPLPQATHRHFQTAADPNEPADVARVDLRCPVKWCPCVASELTSRANKKDCKVCGKPIEEWRSHMPRTCKACHAERRHRDYRARDAARSTGLQPVSGASA